MKFDHHPGDLGRPRLGIDAPRPHDGRCRPGLPTTRTPTRQRPSRFAPGRSPPLHLHPVLPPLRHLLRRSGHGLLKLHGPFSRRPSVGPSRRSDASHHRRVAALQQRSAVGQ